MTAAVGRRLAALALAVAVSGCGDPSGPDGPADPPHVPGLVTAPATRAAVTDEIAVFATVVGDDEPVAVREARTALAEAEARLDAANRQVVRLAALAETQVAPRKDLESARADQAAAAAAATRARQTLATFGAAALMPPLPPGARRLEAAVGEADVARVARDAAVVFHALAFPDRPFTGRVAAPAAWVAPATRTAPVRIELADPDQALRPGMTGTAAIAVGPPHDAVVVPAAAVVYDGDGAAVLVAGDGDALVPRRVRLGVVHDDLVEIAEGVAAGERVVTVGAASALSATRQLPADAD